MNLLNLFNIYNLFAKNKLYLMCIVEGPHRGCTKLLRRLRKNPPQNTIIAINIRLSKARYRCRKGFVLLGKSMRTCKRGRWIERGEPKCLGNYLLYKCILLEK